MADEKNKTVKPGGEFDAVTSPIADASQWGVSRVMINMMSWVLHPDVDNGSVVFVGLMPGATLPSVLSFTGDLLFDVMSRDELLGRAREGGDSLRDVIQELVERALGDERVDCVVTDDIRSGGVSAVCIRVDARGSVTKDKDKDKGKAREESEGGK